MLAALQWLTLMKAAPPPCSLSGAGGSFNEVFSSLDGEFKGRVLLLKWRREGKFRLWIQPLNNGSWGSRTPPTSRKHVPSSSSQKHFQSASFQYVRNEGRDRGREREENVEHLSSLKVIYFISSLAYCIICGPELNWVSNMCDASYFC